MSVNKNCTVCNMELDVVNFLKHRTVCKTCYNKKRRKNNKNISHHNRKSKLLITITIPITIEPQTFSDEVLEILELTKFRIPRSTRT